MCSVFHAFGMVRHLSPRSDRRVAIVAIACRRDAHTNRQAQPDRE